MKNIGKKLLGLAAIGGVIAGVVYYFKKNDTTENDLEDDFENEDFDLDEDLKPVSDREYVSLTPSSEEAEVSGDAAGEISEEEAVPDASEEAIAEDDASEEAITEDDASEEETAVEETTEEETTEV